MGLNFLKSLLDVGVDFWLSTNLFNKVLSKVVLLSLDQKADGCCESVHVESMNYLPELLL